MLMLEGEDFIVKFTEFVRIFDTAECDTIEPFLVLSPLQIRERGMRCNRGKMSNWKA